MNVEPERMGRIGNDVVVPYLRVPVLSWNFIEGS
jgi:hypothetical protein